MMIDEVKVLKNSRVLMHSKILFFYILDLEKS